MYLQDYSMIRFVIASSETQNIEINHLKSLLHLCCSNCIVILSCCKYDFDYAAADRL